MKPVSPGRPGALCTVLGTVLGTVLVQAVSGLGGRYPLWVMMMNDGHDGEELNKAKSLRRTQNSALDDYTQNLKIVAADISKLDKWELKPGEPKRRKGVFTRVIEFCNSLFARRPEKEDIKVSKMHKARRYKGDANFTSKSVSWFSGKDNSSVVSRHIYDGRSSCSEEARTEWVRFDDEDEDEDEESRKGGSRNFLAEPNLISFD